MSAIPLGVQVRKRELARLPYMRHTNMLVEKDETNQVDGLVHIQRAGLAPFVVMPEGPNRGINRVDDTLGGNWIMVNGANAYRVDFNGGVTTLLGAVAGTEIVKIAIGRERALFCANGLVTSIDGGGYLPVPIPDDQLVADVLYLNGYFILPISGSDRYYWIGPGEFEPDPLSYATAERKADNLLSAMSNGDELWLLGGDTIEVWFPTSDPDVPWMRASGRSVDQGIISRDTVVQLGSNLYGVGTDRVAYRLTPTLAPISDYAIAEQIRLADSGDISLFSYRLGGHNVLVMRLGARGTWAYDETSGLWSNYASYGQPEWRARCGFTSESVTLIGDMAAAQLWVLDDTISRDGNDLFVREVTGGVEVLGRPVRCDSVSMRVAAGWSPSLALEPMVRMCWSDDQGATWSEWRLISLGKTGKYAGEPVERQLGRISAPGRLFWLQMTDDAIFRINYMRMNEAFA